MTERDKGRARLRDWVPDNPLLWELNAVLQRELEASHRDRGDIKRLETENTRLRGDLCNEQQALAHERFLNGNLRADLARRH